MKKHVRIAACLLAFAILILTSAFPLASSAHAATGLSHFHPTQRATHTPPQVPCCGGGGGCNWDKITSSSATIGGYPLYVELDGTFDSNGIYCGQVITYAQVIQQAFGPPGTLTACVAFGRSSAQGCSSTNVPSTNNNQFWFVWSLTVDTNGNAVSGLLGWLDTISLSTPTVL